MAKTTAAEPSLSRASMLASRTTNSSSVEARRSPSTARGSRMSPRARAAAARTGASASPSRSMRSGSTLESRSRPRARAACRGVAGRALRAGPELRRHRDTTAPRTLARLAAHRPRRARPRLPRRRALGRSRVARQQLREERRLIVGAGGLVPVANDLLREQPPNCRGPRLEKSRTQLGTNVLRHPVGGADQGIDDRLGGAPLLEGPGRLEPDLGVLVLERLARRRDHAVVVDLAQGHHGLTANRSAQIRHAAVGRADPVAIAKRLPEALDVVPAPQLLDPRPSVGERAHDGYRL